MAKRKIIKIDEVKCTGCGLCIPNCPEGAIQIIDGKARLVSDLFCDGLGACIGHCPEGAISIEEREAEEYDERKTMENIVKQGKNVIRAHLEHLREHQQIAFFRQAIDFLRERKIEISLEEAAPSYGQLRSPASEVAGGRRSASFGSSGAHNFSGCPGSKVMDLKNKHDAKLKERESAGLGTQLSNWPVQLMLVPPFAPYLNHADLLIAADCVPFVYADFHQDLLKGKVLLVGCPKLDDLKIYQEKISQILKNNQIKSITYAHMEVPCCFGLVNIVKEAIAKSSKDTPFKEITISIKGERLQ